jgi:histidine triad (HIT) family protein
MSVMEGGAPSAEISRDALLCALVLAPLTFPRNRFYSLFTHPWARRTRSRATQLRTMVRHLSAHDRWIAEVREMRPSPYGGVILRYGVPGLSLERTAMLDPLEIAVIRFALSRRTHPLPRPDDASMVLTDDDRRLVEGALAQLAPFDGGAMLRRNDDDGGEPEGSPLEFGETAHDRQPGGSNMCLFCRMITREVPAQILLEDDDLLAIADIKPAAPTHALVFPKKHLVSLSDASSDDALLLGKLMLGARRVAEQAGLFAPGYRVVVNTGADGGQSVFHLHLHVLGGRALGWPPG